MSLAHQPIHEATRNIDFGQVCTIIHMLFLSAGHFASYEDTFTSRSCMLDT